MVVPRISNPNSREALNRHSIKPITPPLADHNIDSVALTLLYFALMAIARKVIVLDMEKLNALDVAAIGFVVLSMSVGYWLICKLSKRSHIECWISTSHRRGAEALH